MVCAHRLSPKKAFAQALGTIPRPPPFIFYYPNSSKSCSDGKGANTVGERCHWKPQFQSCMQAVQDIGRLIVDLKMTTSSGSTLNDQAAFSRDSTACSTWRRA